MNPIVQTTDLAILCGGRGVRLKPLTDRTPKALAPIRGKPMLDHIMNFFRDRGFVRFTLCVGYRAEMIRDHFRGWTGREHIFFSDAGESASMLQRLWALRQSSGDRLLVVYGDTFINLEPEQLLSHHLRAAAAATIVTAPIQNPFGVVTFDNNRRVLSFQEKPIQNHYIGCMVLEKQAFEFVDDTMLAQPDGSGLVALFHRLASQQHLSAFVHEGLQITFNTETELQNAEQALGQYFTYQEQS